MRAWLPYLSSALVHGGFLATLHWAWQAPAPPQYAIEGGQAQIELLMTLPPDADETPAAETPVVELTAPVEQPAETAPEVPVERRPAELPSQRLALAETSLPDLPAEAAVVQPHELTAQDQPPRAAEPQQPLERRTAEQSRAPAPFQAPAVAGAAVDELPRKLPRNPAPPYPAAAYTARQEGVALVRVQISAAGLVTEARLEESSGFVLLDQSALATVRQWRFSPARQSGVAVAHEILVPVRFQLSARRPA